MSDIDQLFKQIPIADIADQLGVDKATAEQGVAAALPALLHGLDANAKDEAGAASILKALSSKDTSLIDGGISLGDIDTDDGAKIVKHIFGGATSDVEAKLGGITGGGSGLMSKLLPILAPIVLAYLAGKIGGKIGGKKTTKKSSSDGGLGDILGSVLGGATGGSGGGGLGDVLGSVLGGATGGSGGGGLGDILGGLLGGGRR